MNNKFGCGFPNGDVSDQEFAEFVSIPWSNVVVLHHQAGYLPRLRAALPKTRLVGRYYAKNLLAENPSEYAQAVCTEAIHWRDYTREWQYACEPNLEMESGPGYDDPDRVAQWCVDVATELRRLAPWMVIHSVPFSPIADWWLYYTALMEHQEVFHVIQCHAYESAQAMESIVLSVCSQTDKPVFISECNGPGTMDLFHWIQDKPQILGAAYFIWTWRNAAPGWNRDLKGSALESELRELAAERGMEVTRVDSVEQGMKAIWKRMLGKTFDPTNVFFRKAVELAREGVYVHPLKGGPWEYKVGNYFCTYTDPPMHVLDEDWDNVQTGFPPNQ